MIHATASRARRFAWTYKHFEISDTYDLAMPAPAMHYST